MKKSDDNLRQIYTPKLLIWLVNEKHIKLHSINRDRHDLNKFIFFVEEDEHLDDYIDYYKKNIK